MNIELFKKYFDFQTPTAMLKTLYKLNDKKKNKQFVDVINTGLRDFKEEIKDIGKKEKKLKNHMK